jgi:mannose-6-phosphate isomerase-like protein (cupin superfamily)
VFVVLEGTLTLVLGETPDRVEVGAGGVAVNRPNCPIQLRNDGDVEVVVFAYGAPPVTGQGELLDELEPS